MGVIVAIIGQVGVGKSLLKKQLLQQGVTEIDITPQLCNLLGSSKQDQAWRYCLQGNYHSVSSHVKLLTNVKVTAIINDAVLYARQRSGVYVVEIPCFISVRLYAELKIDGIIFVDCAYAAQTQYLKDLGATDTAVHYLRTHAQSQELYRAVATDILHNSVSVSHIEWASTKILQSYAIQLEELVG